MNREEKEVKEGESKRGGEVMGEKLKRGILLGKREGNSTPSPTWKFGLIQPDGTLIQDFNSSPNSSNPLSARKLGANLWEMKPQFNLRLNNNGPSFSHRKEAEISRVHKELDDEPLQSPSKQPTSGVNSRKQIAASLTEYNLRVEKVAQAQQPLSPASYCSSMEMAPHRPATKPDGSLVSNGKFAQSSQSLKTSTELLKVLNRIWSLEEKHALDMSLVKALRRELDQSQACIQELLQGKERNRDEIGTLMRQVTEYKVSRKKEQDRIKESVKLVERQLEHELKLRRHSEKHHNKLAKELSDMKCLFSNALREIEREKKARALVEGLCDEFAKGIKEYEQEVRLMKQKSCEDQIGREGNDRLILHMCEAWLDERAQTKLRDVHGYDISEKHSALDKLCVEIEAFLRAKQSDNSTRNDHKGDLENGTMSRSSESIHLNEPASAPWKRNDEDDSISIGNRYSQFCRGASLKQANASMRQQGEISSYDHYKGTTNNTKPANKRVQSRTISDPSSSKRQSEDGSSKSRMQNSYDIRSPRMPTKGETMERSSRERRIRSPSFDPSTFAGPPSPVRRWTSEVLAAADPDISESSSIRQESIKLNTLKSKLMEARLEGQRSRARISRGSSQVD